MKRKVRRLKQLKRFRGIFLVLALTVGLMACGKKTGNSDVDSLNEEQTQEVQEPEVVYDEPEGKIFSGMGTVYDGKLYYAVNDEEYKTGIIERDIATGQETTVVDLQYTQGFSSLEFYKGYIYCVWDKSPDESEENKVICRFNIKDFSVEELCEGHSPVVANDCICYWQGDVYVGYTLYKYDLETKTSKELGMFPIAAGTISGGYYYVGIYDHFYKDGKLFTVAEFEECGSYNEDYGSVLCKANAKRNLKIFDIDGDAYDPSQYTIEYLRYNLNPSYELDQIYKKTEITGGGKMIMGASGEKTALEYVDGDGNITVLQTWEDVEE